MIDSGQTLKQIIKSLGNKNYARIEFKSKYRQNGKMFDTFFGACSYENGELIPLDGDTYSLEDRYDEYKEYKNKFGQICLTVWEYIPESEDDLW